MSVPSMGNSLPKKGKELPVRRRQKSSAYAAEIARALHLELGGSHRAIKTLMRWTHASERAAKCWLGGTSGPSGEHLIVLMRNSETVLDTVLALAHRRTRLQRGRLEALKLAMSSSVVAIEEILDEEERAAQPLLPLEEATR